MKATTTRKRAGNSGTAGRGAPVGMASPSAKASTNAPTLRQLRTVLRRIDARLETANKANRRAAQLLG